SLRTSVPFSNVALLVLSFGLKPSKNVPFKAGPDPEMSSRNGITVPRLTRLASHRPPTDSDVPADSAIAMDAPKITKEAARPAIFDIALIVLIPFCLISREVLTITDVWV
ncbi:MAG: hypothetical protein WBL61_11835, partial [Bryobacteraceae bacterium]